MKFKKKIEKAIALRKEEAFGFGFYLGWIFGEIICYVLAFLFLKFG